MVQVNTFIRKGPGMSENIDPCVGDDTPGDRPGWRDRSAAIVRATAAIAAGLAVGVMTRDVGLGITTAAAGVSILRELFARPGQ